MKDKSLPNDENLKSISEKIIDLKNADLNLRNQLINEKKLGMSYHSEMAKLHNENAKILDEIIDEIGFPTPEMIGDEASDAAWLIIQHAIEQPQFMKKCAKLLEKICIIDQSQTIKLAYLTDRIAVLENQPQLYGTQFDWNENGEMSPNIYDDILSVNQRRKFIGLNSLEEQTKIMRARVQSENQFPPTDFEERLKEIEIWKKTVGWKK